MATDDIARLGIEISTDDIDQASRKLDRLERKSGEAEKGVTKSTGGMGRSFSALKGGIIAAAGAMAALATREAIMVRASFQKLEASLETVTGSALAASNAFRDIQQYASETPFSVQQLTESFIKLKALGLDPSERAIMSYGNTASAMGKDLNQMIEAVADATTGEFERLKEFGIKASSEGDRVKFTFQGVTTEIGKNADEIQQYLLAIGENQFAGAMEKQMDTLNGAFSNLSDSSDRFFNALGAAIEDDVSSFTKGLAGMLDYSAKLIEIWSQAEVDAPFLDQQVAIRDVNEELTKANEAIARYEQLLVSANENGLPPESVEALNNQLAFQKERAEELARAIEVLNGQYEAMTEAQGGDPEERAAKEEEAWQAQLDAQLDRMDMEQRLMEQRAEMHDYYAERDRKRNEDRIRDEQNTLKRQEGVFASALAAGAQSNKALFEAQKAYRISKVAMEAPGAIADSYAWGASWGGPPAGAAMAAVAGVAMASYAASIASASFGGGGGGGGSAAGSAGGVGFTPSAPAEPFASAQPIEEAPPAREVRVTVEGDGPNSEGMRQFAKNLAETLKDMGSDTDLVLS